MPHSYKGQDELYDLRMKIRNREKVTPEEYREVIQALREGREKAKTEKAKKPKSTKPKVELPENLNDLFTKPVSE